MFAIVLLASLLGFQEPTVDASFKVDYIVLDVVAEDQGGQVVTDLELDDFRLRENRKKVNVELFEKLDFRSVAEGGAPPDPNEDPILQTLIMVLDLGRASPGAGRAALDRVETFLGALPPDNEMQIFLYSLNLGVISKSFSSDPAAILADLAGYREKLTNSNPNEQIWNRLGILENEYNQCLARERTGPDIENRRGAGMISTCLSDIHSVFLSREERMTLTHIDVLKRFMRFLAKVDGLKSLYLISPGLPVEVGYASSRLVQAYRSQDGAVTSASPFSAGGTNSRFGAQPEEDSPYGSDFDRIPATLTLPTRDLTSKFRDLAQMALANRIIFHTFNLSDEKGKSGVTSRTGISSDDAYLLFKEELGKGLSWLAGETGGVFRSSGKLETRLTETVQGHKYYYVLGYPMPKRSLRKYRKIQLECLRQGVVLRHRKGYSPSDMKAFSRE